MKCLSTGSCDLHRDVAVLVQLHRLSGHCHVVYFSESPGHWEIWKYLHIDFDIGKTWGFPAFVDLHRKEAQKFLSFSSSTCTLNLPVNFLSNSKRSKINHDTSSDGLLFFCGVEEVCRTSVSAGFTIASTLPTLPLVHSPFFPVKRAFKRCSSLSCGS